MHKLGRHADLVTLYRVIKVLKKVGLVRQTSLQHNRAYYELADPTDHHHLICMKCDKVEDFKGCNIKTVVARALAQAKNFAFISEHSLELFGLCKACNQKTAA